jgi:hypothetical protein
MKQKVLSSRLRQRARLMYRLRIYIASFILAASPSLAAQTIASANPERVIDDIRTLTTPQMEGRGDGSKGLTRAQQVLVHRYAGLGLQPKGTKGFLQPFDIVTGAELTGGNYFSVEEAGNRRKLKLKEDYIPFSFSAAGNASGGLVFAGYGVAADDWNYDDYKGVNVEGKIVVILKGEPALEANHRLKDGATHHAETITKAILARGHGAKAVVVLNGKLRDGEEDLLPRFAGAGGQEDVGIPIVQLKDELAADWFHNADKNLLELQQQIDSSGAPASFTFPETLRANLAVGVRKKHAVISNVLAYLPGKTDEYIILGAHYDHLGKGEYGSLAPSQVGQFHPGADDNASGIAALLELARLLSPLQGQLPRGILFASFAGEELGLLGSAAWVRDPTLPLNKAVAMLNMDMVGRVSKDTIYIGGVGTAAVFRPILNETTAHSELNPQYSDSGYSSSDHTSFVVKQIPVLFFFSGLHSDYHKPSDTWEKIDAKAAARVVNLVADTGVRIDEAPEKPAFITVAETHPSGSESSRGSGYGPYFGSIPDFGQVETGVRFSDVRPGSPAAKAGLQAGDTLIEFRDQPIKNLYDFTDALRRSKVGDVVEVTVLRDGKPLKVQVTLEQRR